jgi:pectate lyase
MNSSDPAVGFGKNVTGGGTAAATAVTSADMLKQKLKTLGRSVTPTVLELQGNGTVWNFGGKELKIAASNLTIRASATAFVLQNVKFIIDLDHATNILLQDLIFRGTESKRDARDGVTIIATNLEKNENGVDAESEMRITHCAFDGYYDISLDTKSVLGRAGLFATIDSCLFFDSRPGLNGPNNSTFVNRGALNLSALNKKNADSRFTVTRNVFVNVWRRCPRIAGGNFGHIFNNLLFQWGFTSPGSPDSTDPTWLGMATGGGKDRANDGSMALIQANRFIPWVQKQGLNDAVQINATTTVDLSSGTDLANEFDLPAGTIPPLPAGATTPVQPTAQRGGSVATITPSTFYTGTRTAPTVSAAGTFPWRTLVGAAGSPFADGPSTAARNAVLAVLNVADGSRS